MQRGALRSIRIGRLRRISVTELELFVERQGDADYSEMGIRSDQAEL
jgi:hypothetical protein